MRLCFGILLIGMILILTLTQNTIRLFLFLFFYIVIVYVTYGTPYSFTYTNQKHVKYHHDTKLTPIVISDTSFESGMSEDYAIPPDALSQADSTYMEASIPSILMRTSYIDSPNKKMESLEKVDFVLEINNWMII